MPSRSSPAKKQNQKQSDPAASYDEFKEYEGRKYTGMKIGRSHYWIYDSGQWKETKITPDLWQISYAVTKRRKGRAPEGSGVPVGTAYHWYVVAHQKVEKLDANDYTTSLAGLKFKVAHRRAGSEKWSATPKTQRKRMIRFLRDVIADLEREADVPAETADVETPVESKRTPASRAGAKRAIKSPPSMAQRKRRRRASR